MDNSDAVRSALATPPQAAEFETVVFDGIYRPEMHGRHWLAIAYVEREGGQRFRSVHGGWQNLQMKPNIFNSYAEAQAKCDELNAKLVEKAKG